MRRRALLMGGKQQKPLIIRVDTTKSGATPNDTFRIPANAPGETYNYKVDWGDGVMTSNHTGDAEHTYAIGGIYDIKIYGKFPRFYFNNGGDRLKLLEVRDWGEIRYSANQTNAFYGCENLTFIATDDNGWYNGITIGNSMFRDNSLTSLPDNMTLSNLTIGNSMFHTNSLTVLPVGMELPLLTSGDSMFRFNSLTSLPDGMTLGNLTNGNNMFRNNPITSAIGLKLYEINDGELFMNSANLPVNQYSEILIDIEANNPNDDVTIHFGNSKYNMTAQTARDNLLKRGWDITDGGLV